jgi:hypothetical protein
MSNFVYGNSLGGGVDSGTSGGTVGPTNGAGQIDRILQELKEEEKRAPQK